MTQTEPVTGGNADAAGGTDWTGRTVYDSDGRRLGKLAEVRPGDGGTRWGVVRSTLGRRLTVPLDGAVNDERGGLTVATDRASAHAAPAIDAAPGTAASDGLATTDLSRHYTGRGVLADAHALQHERYGGSKLGSAFFGWLVAVGLTVLLGIVAGAISAAVGTNAPVTDAGLTVAVLVVAYFAGGYVAGRLARFDGARNGFLTWVIGVLASVVLAVVGAFVGAQYDVLNRVPLPTLPTSLEQVTVPGLVLVAVAVLGTLVAAMLGAKAGEGFHRRVDRAATEAL
jgi:PRC-barrel domain